MLNFLLQNKPLREQSGSNRVLISVLTRFVDLSQPFRILAMLAALAFFIFLILIPIARAQSFIGTPQVIDNGIDTGLVGQYTSQAIVNGNPAITYYDATNGDLKYIRATNPQGTAWGTPVIIDSVNDVGQWNSLAIVDGKPAVSYYDATNDNLKYARADDLAGDGETWGATVTVFANGTAGAYTSLEVVDGKPAISYYDATNGTLKYVRALGSDGIILPWGSPVTVDTGGVGAYTSLEIVNGNPAISYYNVTSANLKYVRANSADGASWGTLPITIDSSGSVGSRSTLRVVDGMPAISYYRGSPNIDLKYVRATHIDGATWGAPVLLDQFVASGSHNSLAVVDGNPAIGYHDAAGILKFIRATNASGATAAMWGAPVTVDSPGSAGQVGTHVSLTIVDGNPAISYYDSTNGDLKYVRATDAAGKNFAAAWDVPLTIDKGSNGNVGQYTSLTMVNGFPAVAYYDGAEGNLRYVRATNAAGTTWGTPVTIDTTGTVGLYASLAVVNDFPAISYYDASSTTADLKYARALDIDGANWGTPITIDEGDGGNVGQYTSLKVVNGKPAVSYYDVTNGNLKFIRANNSTGVDVLDWTTPPVPVDTIGTVGQHTSLEVVAGKPAISYYDATSFDLKYVRADSADGSTWESPVSLDTGGDIGQYTSLEIVNGNPAISYYSASGGSLRYIRATDTTGGSWIAAVPLDTLTADVGRYTSLAVVNGNPAISYYDTTNANLKYISATTNEGASAAAWGPPVPVDSVGNVGEHTSLAVFNCNPAVSYYAATNFDLKYVRSRTIWSGIISQAWEDAVNWGFGCVPAPGESVVLPATGVTNEAVISTNVVLNDLTLGANRTLRVAGNRTLRIHGVLTLNGGIITVDPGSKLLFGCSASVIGASSADFIVGAVQKEFCSTGSFTFPVGDATGTAEYSPMTAVITGGAFPGGFEVLFPPSLTVSVTDTWLPGLAPANSVSRYWSVTESGSLTADITFQYLTADVNGSETAYGVFRNAGGTATQAPAGEVEPLGNTGFVPNVVNFSDWGIGTLAPTSASVYVSGRVLAGKDNGVGNAVVSLTGSGGIRTAITNPFGYYRFDDVEVGQTYVISVSSKRYQFASQVVFVTEDVGDLNFTAQ